MNPQWIDIALTIGLQHAWQSVALLLLAVFMLKCMSLSAVMRSWLWLAVLLLAVLLPLLVFAPSHQINVLNAVAQPVAPQLENTAGPVPSVIDKAVIVVENDTGSMSWTLMQALAAVWVCGTAWHLVQLVRAWRAARQLRAHAQPEQRLTALMRDSLPAGTTILESERAPSPMAIGLLRPCILMPRELAMNLPDEALRDVIHHEIAHVRRKDRWVVLIQFLVMSFFWWNPVMRMIATRLDLAREIACDESAVQQTGQAGAYAKVLLDSIDRLMTPASPVLASTLFGSSKGIKERVMALMNRDRKPSRRTTRLALVSWGVVISGFVTIAYAATPRVQVPLAQGSVELIEAVKGGNGALAKQLIESGASIEAGVNGDGTPLIAASKTGNLAMVNLLIELGANVDQTWPGDGTALIAAAHGGHAQVVERLLENGANVNLIALYDETALISAVRAGRLEVVKYLVEHGANPSQGAWADGQRWRTPLNQAHDEGIRSYLLANGAR